MVIGLLRALWGALSRTLSPPFQQHPHNSTIFLYLAKPLFQHRDSFQIWWMQRCMKFCFSSTDMFAALRLVLFFREVRRWGTPRLFLVQMNDKDDLRWVLDVVKILVIVSAMNIRLLDWRRFSNVELTRLVFPLSPQVTLDQEGPPRTYAENLAVSSSGLDSESMWSGQWLGRVCPGAMLRRGPFEPRFKTPDLACNPKPDRLVAISHFD